RVPRATAIEAALVLGPAGEFAFVILAVAMAEGVVPPAFAQGVLLSATLSLFAVPLLAAAGRRLRARIASAAAPELDNEGSGFEQGRVLIVGYGRVGQLVGELLQANGVPFTALDSDPQLVARAR